MLLKTSLVLVPPAQSIPTSCKKIRLCSRRRLTVWAEWEDKLERVPQLFPFYYTGPSTAALEPAKGDIILVKLVAVERSKEQQQRRRNRPGRDVTLVREEGNKIFQKWLVFFFSFAFFSLPNLLCGLEKTEFIFSSSRRDGITTMFYHAVMLHGIQPHIRAIKLTVLMLELYHVHGAYVPIVRFILIICNYMHRAIVYSII